MVLAISCWYFIKVFTQTSESTGRNLGSLQVLSKRLTAILLMLETCPANTFLQETNSQMCGSNGKLEGILKCMIQVMWCVLCLVEKIWLELLTRVPDTRKIKGMNLVKAGFYSIGEMFLCFTKYYPSYGALYNVNIQCTTSCSYLPYSLMLLEFLPVFYFYHRIPCLDWTLGKYMWKWMCEISKHFYYLCSTDY